jgi:competence protein ComEA
LEYRRQIGGFKSVEQLLEVKGIGPKKLERLRPYVRL